MKRFFLLLLLSFLLQACSSIGKIVENEFAPATQEDILQNTAAEYIVDKSIGGEIGKVLETEMSLLKKDIQDSIGQHAMVRQPDEGILIVFSSDDIFKNGRKEINETFEQTLMALTHCLQDFRHVKVYILVHTDNNASDYISLSLSEKRAKVIRKTLIKNGIRANQIHAEGKGALVPVISNETEEGRRLNRRVEIAIVADNQFVKDVQRSVKKNHQNQ